MMTFFSGGAKKFSSQITLLLTINYFFQQNTCWGILILQINAFHKLSVFGEILRLQFY